MSRINFSKICISNRFLFFTSGPQIVSCESVTQSGSISTTKDTSPAKDPASRGADGDPTSADNNIQSAEAKKSYFLNIVAPPGEKEKAVAASAATAPLPAIRIKPPSKINADQALSAAGPLRSPSPVEIWLGEDQDLPLDDNGHHPLYCNPGCKCPLSNVSSTL